MDSTPSERRISFVVGSGRSGTSTMSGTLQALGMHVPQPEVASNATNPKGFGEPQWVVEFHERLLNRVRVQTGDARPSAWFDTGRPAMREVFRNELYDWLEGQFAEAEGRRGADQRARGQGPSAGVVPRHVARGRDPLPGDAVVHHHAPPGDRGGRLEAEVLRRQAERDRPHRRLGQRHAAHRGGHPRLRTSVRPLRRPPRRLDGAGLRAGRAAALRRRAARVGAGPAQGALLHRPEPAPRPAHLGRRGGAGPAARDRPGELGRPRPAGRQGRRHPRAARDARRAPRGLHRLLHRGRAAHPVDRGERPARGRRRPSATAWPRWPSPARGAAPGSRTPSARWSPPAPGGP